MNFFQSARNELNLVIDKLAEVLGIAWDTMGER